MGLDLQILGAPGDDNAVLVRVNTGQATHRLLFDCGEDVLKPLEFSEIQAIDHLFFSHLHMDHVAGFDAFFRANWARESRPNHLWGPAGTARILQNRFRGTLWNLHAGSGVTWLLHDVLEATVQSTRLAVHEAFEIAHLAGSRAHDGVILQHADFSVQVLVMDHRTPSLAFIVREAQKVNLEPAKLAALGLKPGAWIKALKDAPADQPTLEIDGVLHDIGVLRQALLTVAPGDAVAYLTDFVLDEAALSRLEVALQGCRLVVCESQYLHADLELARRNYHMTARLAAQLALRAGVHELVLFHVSTRYTPAQWEAMLEEARVVFPNTHFPSYWNIGN
jgi:ribonuclease Z